MTSFKNFIHRFGTCFASLILILFYVAAFIGCTSDNQETEKPKMMNQWEVSQPVLLPGKKGSFDETAVKDPSFVRYEGRWHLFYTGRGRGHYSLGYVSAETMEDLNAAPRTYLEQLDDQAGYSAAPQVFYFEPQQLWYLIYQNTDDYYQPVYSVNSYVGNPEDWAAPQNLIEKDEEDKWIDFWIIADDSLVYLFYTQSHWDVMVRSTRIEDFPSGWGEAEKVLSGVHEAVHIYKEKDQPLYQMIYESNGGGVDGYRYFGKAVADKLDGPWVITDSLYASGEKLVYPSGVEQWTELVSHGEAVRTGYDQRLEYDAENPVWLIQGLNRRDFIDEYAELPWKLGLIK